MLQKISQALSVICVIFILAPINCRAFINNNGVNDVPGVTGKIGFPKYYNEICSTKGFEGKCLPIRSCPGLRELIASRGGIQSRGTADLLKKRICGHQGREAHLCCPDDREPTRHPMLPPFEECGVASGSRIYNGKSYSHGTHPWLVGLGYKKDKEFKIGCGGTLITKRHVLTAAHCFARNSRDRIPQFTHGILGEHSLSKATEIRPPIILLIEDRKNKGYSSSSFYNDIELLTLEKDVEFTRYIKPACLPIKDYLKHFDLEDIKMEVAGWGRTKYHDLTLSDTPRLATVPLVSMIKCKEVYKGVPGVMVDGTQICLGGNEKDACDGDSGGPAVYYETKMFHRYFLMGVTAFGGRCGQTNYPGVYTYVPAYIEWIIENL